MMLDSYWLIHSNNQWEKGTASWSLKGASYDKGQIVLPTQVDALARVFPVVEDFAGIGAGGGGGGGGGVAAAANQLVHMQVHVIGPLTKGALCFQNKCDGLFVLFCIMCYLSYVCSFYSFQPKNKSDCHLERWLYCVIIRYVSSFQSFQTQEQEWLPPRERASLSQWPL